MVTPGYNASTGKAIYNAIANKQCEGCCGPPCPFCGGDSVPEIISVRLENLVDCGCFLDADLTHSWQASADVITVLESQWWKADLFEGVFGTFPNRFCSWNGVNNIDTPYPTVTRYSNNDCTGLQFPIDELRVVRVFVSKFENGKSRVGLRFQESTSGSSTSFDSGLYDPEDGCFNISSVNNIRNTCGAGSGICNQCFTDGNAEVLEGIQP
jgi:hypothetical protein